MARPPGLAFEALQTKKGRQGSHFGIHGATKKGPKSIRRVSVGTLESQKYAKMPSGKGSGQDPKNQTKSYGKIVVFERAKTS